MQGDLEGVFKLALEVSNSASNFKSLLAESLATVNTPPRGGETLQPGIVVLPKAPCLMFIGDLHGDILSAYNVLKSVWSKFAEDHCTMVFLGDYIDRGDYQLETLALVLLLKKHYPGRVVLLRGNHEPPEWLIPYPHDYPYYLAGRFGSEWRELYSLSLNLFDNMPVVAVLEGSLVALHGGPPRRVLSSSSWREAFEAGRDSFTRNVLEDILWSDPIESDLEYTESPRGAGVLFGRRITEKTIQLIRGKYIIRGHEAVNGVETRHEGRVFTVFTASTVYGVTCAGVLELTYSVLEETYKPTTLCVEPRLSSF